MTAFDRIISIVFALIGAGLLGYLVYLIWGSFRGKVSFRPRILKKAEKSLALIDELIKETQYARAAKELPQLLISAYVEDPAVRGKIVEHHQHLLSRAVVLANELQGSLSNIATLERLFLEKAEIDKELAEELLRLKSLRQKRKGKSTPEWGTAEFEKRIKALKDARRKHVRRIEEELKAASESLQSESSDSSLTYH